MSSDCRRKPGQAQREHVTKGQLKIKVMRHKREMVWKQWSHMKHRPPPHSRRWKSGVTDVLPARLSSCSAFKHSYQCFPHIWNPFVALELMVWEHRCKLSFVGYTSTNILVAKSAAINKEWRNHSAAPVLHRWTWTAEGLLVVLYGFSKLHESPRDYQLIPTGWHWSPPQETRAAFMTSKSAATATWSARKMMQQWLETTAWARRGPGLQPLAEPRASQVRKWNPKFLHTYWCSGIFHQNAASWHPAESSLLLQTDTLEMSYADQLKPTQVDCKPTTCKPFNCKTDWFAPSLWRQVALSWQPVQPLCNYLQAVADSKKIQCNRQPLIFPATSLSTSKLLNNQIKKVLLNILKWPLS